MKTSGSQALLISFTWNANSNSNCNSTHPQPSPSLRLSHFVDNSVWLFQSAAFLRVQKKCRNRLSALSWNFNQKDVVIVRRMLPCGRYRPPKGQCLPVLDNAYLKYHNRYIFPIYIYKRSPLYLTCHNAEVSLFLNLHRIFMVPFAFCKLSLYS